MKKWLILSAMFGCLACGFKEESRNNGSGTATKPNLGAIQKAQLSSVPREAVVLEAFYGLDWRHNGTSPKKLNGLTIGAWNYLSSDLNAYGVVKNWYGCGWASMWTRNGGSCGYKAMGYNSFYDYPKNYGLFGSYGRGGQCKFFANLVLYRSGIYQRRLPTYAEMKNSCRSIRYARPGDLVFTYNSCAGSHTGIVVAVLAGNPDQGTVTMVDMIDANYVTWGGVDEEIIGRHPLLDKGSLCSASNLAKYCVYNIY